MCPISIELFILLVNFQILNLVSDSIIIFKNAENYNNPQLVVSVSYSIGRNLGQIFSFGFGMDLNQKGGFVCTLLALVPT